MNRVTSTSTFHEMRSPAAGQTRRCDHGAASLERLRDCLELDLAPRSSPGWHVSALRSKAPWHTDLGILAARFCEPELSCVCSEGDP